MKQGVSGGINRKAARKQERQQKKQRKALHYQRYLHKNFTQKAATHDKIRPTKGNRLVTKKVEKSLPSVKPPKKAAGKLRCKNQPALGFADVHTDPLLAFAERALEAGILKSDGEFDEDEMNRLFDEEGSGEDYKNEEEMEVDSNEEAYLVGNKFGDDDRDQEVMGLESDRSEDEADGEDARSPATKRNFGEISDTEEQPSSAAGTPVAIQRQLKGLINKVTLGNLESIASSVVQIYNSSIRRHVVDAVIEAIMCGLESQPHLLDSFILTHASVIASLTHVSSLDFAGLLLERLVQVIDKNRPRSLSVTFDDEIAPSRIVMNCITMVAYLYNLQVASASLILGLVQEATSSLGELDVEILVKLIRICGAQLRRDNPTTLKDIIMAIMSKTASVTIDQQTSRFKFMIETIQDLKNNRQKLVAVQYGELEAAKKSVRNFIRSNNRCKTEPIQVTLDDIRNVSTEGKWWKVGAAWNPGAAISNEAASSAGIVENTNGGELKKLAIEQRMNTDVRRAIFATLMSSEDYLDAFQRLLALKLTSRQEREVANVLLHCCVHEKTYNPFYAMVALRFLQAKHNFVITFKYALWDRLRQFEEDKINPRKIVFFAKFYAFQLARRALPLSILKKASFTQASDETVLFLQVFLVSLFEAVTDDNVLRSIFNELNHISKRTKDAKDDLFDMPGESQDEQNDDEELGLRRQELETLRGGLRIFMARRLFDEHVHSNRLDSGQLRRQVELAISVLE